MSSKQLYTVFVYGTLKRGEPNHHWFTKANNGHWRFLCEAETTEKYPLIIGTKYNIPFLLYEPGTGNHVAGELYEVDDNVLADLDVLEDHPNYYVRDQYDVKSLSDGRQMKAWIYFIRNFRPHLLKQRLFKSYSDSGEHGLRYVTRYEREPGYSAKAEILTD